MQQDHSTSESPNSIDSVVADSWISVDNQLPNDGDYVLIYAGNYPQSQKYDIVRFEKGISLEEREKMKNGELPFEMQNCVHYDGSWHKPIYTKSERWKVFTSSDEHGNNQKPYSWSNPPMKYFGQDVTHWMPLPSIPSACR